MAPKIRNQRTRRPPVNRRGFASTATQPITVNETNAAEALLAVAFKAHRRNPGTHAENEARAAQYLAEHLINKKIIEAIEEGKKNIQKSAENVINPPQKAQEKTQADSQNETPRQTTEAPFTVKETQPNRTSYSPVEKDYLGSQWQCHDTYLSGDRSLG
jgi:hypothetical protein